MEEMFIHKEGFSRPGKFLEGQIFWKQHQKPYHHQHHNTFKCMVLREGNVILVMWWDESINVQEFALPLMGKFLFFSPFVLLLGMVSIFEALVCHHEVADLFRITLTRAAYFKTLSCVILSESIPLLSTFFSFSSTVKKKYSKIMWC
jgi:hypothetical protein